MKLDPDADFLSAHSRASGNPGSHDNCAILRWIPACAGMSGIGVCQPDRILRWLTVSDRSQRLSGEITMPGTVQLHRVLATKPDKIYRAFIEADAMAKWLPPNGFACTVHHLDAKVGGTFKMSFRNFTTGMSHSFGGKYLDLRPGERLRYTDKFDDPNLPGEMQVTVTLKQVSVGTELTIVQEGIPDAIPAEACYVGWQESLRNLARLVEPEINQ
jgi:uncharacterized protein YndB with AHSA1/START domain